MREIRFAADAQTDVNEQFEYLSKEAGIAVAERFFTSVTETICWLSTTPDIGRSREFNNRELVGIRSFSVRDFDQYLIFYQSADGFIFILAVLHGARDLEAIFIERKG